MSKIEQFKVTINEYLLKNNLSILDKEYEEFLDLYKDSLISIWQNRSIKKRMLLVEDINILFIDYVSMIELRQTYNDFIHELDDKYPPEVVLSEFYKIIIDEYKLFLDEYIDTNNIKIETINSIIKKILLILQNEKNKIITYISLFFEGYDFHINHAINTTIIALIGGMELNFNENELYELGVSGLLHDIGMIKIPEYIINKKEKLTDEEYEIIKKHTIIAYKNISEKNIFSQTILDGIVQHHEQFDGNGYPKKIKNDKIHKYAKILSISDALESQISYRIYKRSKNSHLAFKEVLKNDSNKFDPVFLEAFLKAISIYPPGTLVQLNNNSVGTVYSISSEFPLRPQIKIIIDEFGYKADREIIKDLSKDLSKFIIRVLNKDEFVKNE